MAALLERPDDVALLGYFEVEPLEARTTDGYWCYEVRDSRGIVLRMSVDEHEASVQTELSLHGELIARISQEGAERLALRREGGADVLIGEFREEGQRAELRLQVRPTIVVEWATLMK